MISLAVVGNIALDILVNNTDLGKCVQWEDGLLDDYQPWCNSGGRQSRVGSE